MAFLAKMAGVDLSALGALMNGTPEPNGGPDTDDEGLEQRDAKLEEMARTTGVSEDQLVAKLHRFVQNDPQTAKTLLSQL